MDFLNKGLSQVAELFRSMTPGARIVAGLLLAVVVISLAFLVRQQAAGPDEMLMAGQQFAPAELNAMEAAFGKANLTGWQIDGGRIRIPSGQRGAFMGALADGGALPNEFGSHLRKALDQGGLFVSRKEREERLKIATQQELAEILRNMKGIERASVIYDIAAKRSLSSGFVATASVSVKPIGGQPLDAGQVRNIRHVVAAAKAELKPENVSVTDLNGQTYPATGDNQAAAGADLMRQTIAAYEEGIRQRVERTLTYVPGAVVAVNVEVNEQLSRQSDKIGYDKATSMTERSRSKTIEESRKTPTPGGPPGTRSNSSNPSSQSNEPAEIKIADQNTSTKNMEDEEQTNLAGGEKVSTRYAPLVPKRVTVAVSVPKTYFETIWRQRNGMTDPAQKVDANAVEVLEAEKIKELKAHVAQVLMVEDLKDPVKSVKITSFDVLPQPEIAPPTLAENAVSWFSQYANLLGMTGLGLVSLLMLRSIVRGAPDATPAPIETPAAAAPNPNEDEPTDQPQTPPSRTLRRRESGMSLRDELTELVREDPDAAAAILRSWIGNAS
jgi:flagellar M-ring protein FliF